VELQADFPDDFFCHVLILSTHRRSDGAVSPAKVFRRARGNGHERVGDDADTSF
jgi:hypothetical protein